jgi:hypothetical protein
VNDWLTPAVSTKGNTVSGLSSRGYHGILLLLLVLFFQISAAVNTAGHPAPNFRSLLTHRWHRFLLSLK